MYRKVWYEGIPIDDLRIIFEEALSYIIIQLRRVVATDVKVTGSYKAGFLAFREVDHFKRVIDYAKYKHLTDVPQVIATGGGLHHPLGFDGATLKGLKYIGGLDISFLKGDQSRGVVALTVMHYPSLKVRHESYSISYVHVYALFGSCV